jgi:hypothetical protein
VAVIGRGQPPSSQSDDAVDRLTTRFEAHPQGSIAAVSALYQSMDATAALAATQLIDRATGQSAALPIARTTRVATVATTVAGAAVPTGTPIDLELGTAGLWFGAGPHACPGQALAKTIADAIVREVEAFGAVLDTNSIELDRDHRPVAVWLHVPG